MASAFGNYRFGNTIQTNTISSKETERESIQAAIAGFLKRGGKPKKLPNPVFRPLPLYRKDKDEPIFLCPKQRDTYYRMQAKSEAVEAKKKKAALKESFAHIASSDIKAVIELASEFSAVQITNRTQVPRLMVLAILQYYDITPLSRALGYQTAKPAGA